MSTRYPIKREKRPRSSSDANTSFVKNVTSRMSGLLPTTITKWFSGQRSSSANGSALVTESTDSSTEDEASDIPITPPPAKRMHFSSSPVSNLYTAPETKCTSTNTEPTETYSAVQSPVASDSFRSETKYVSTPLHSPNDESNMSDNEKGTYNSFSENQSIAKKRRSLFDIRTREEACEKTLRNTGRDLSEPYFKPGLFGSPFYRGNTVYGGASSSYIDRSNIKHKKETSINNSSSNSNVTIGQTARRILDLLENYSSPLVEAKRIRCNRFLDSPVKNKNNETSFSYKTQELHVPSVASILLLKKRSRLMDTTSAARQIMASHTSSPEFSPYPVSQNNSSRPKETGDRMTTKMKVRLTRIHGLEKEVNNLDSTVLPPVTLPSMLQIDNDNLPKFTLDSSVPKSLSSNKINTQSSNVVTTDSNFAENSVDTVPVSVTTTTENIATVNDLSKPCTTIQKTSFEFSSPVKIYEESELGGPTLPNYIFGHPDASKEKLKDKEKNNNEPLISESDNLKTGSQSVNWKCEDCWVSNKSDSKKCVCCGSIKPTTADKETKKCADCKAELIEGNSTKCGVCKDKINIADKSEKIITSTNLSKWKCQDCWVSNDEEVDKCACCGAIKPEALINKCNNIENEWKCEDCWIKNKNSADKCAACGGLKPSSKQTNSKDFSSQPKSVVTKTSNDLISKTIKSQAQKWECSICLVHNENNRSQCVCCDEPKPGTFKQSDLKSFNFGTNQNTIFKFGIDPKLNVVNKNFESSSVWELETAVKEPETNNNDIPQPNFPTQSFNFGIPKQSENKVSEEKEIKGDLVPNWIMETFGMPKSNNIKSTPTKMARSPKLISAKVNEDKTSMRLNEKHEKLQEVPNIEKPNSTLTETPQEIVGLIGIPLSAGNHLSKPLAQPSWPSLPTFENTEQNRNMQNETGLEMKMPQNSFAFSASNLKPISNLFTVPSTTSTTTSFSNKRSSSVSSLFQNSDSAIPSSFYQKNGSTSPPKLSFFNKTETATTVAASSLVTSAPTFTFGGSVQSSLLQSEKPKFKFNFGNNDKSNTPTLFSMPKTNANNNILSGNSLSNTNTISGGTVSGGNTLSSVNPIPAYNFTAGISMGGNSSMVPAGNNLEMGNNPSFQLMPGMAKKDNVWPSGNRADSNKMSSENNLDMGSDPSTIQTGNLFSASKKGNVWSAVSNTSNDSLGTLKLNTGNNLESVDNTLGMPSGTMFGVPGKKENIWGNNNSTNLFGSNTGANNAQKPAPFSFSSSMQFNSNRVAPTQTFGSPSQTLQNIFVLSNQNNNGQSSLFSNPVQNPTSQNIFGAPQAPNNPTMPVGVFGAPNAGPSSSFGTPNSSMSNFETSSMSPVPTATFNFGAQQTPGVFGFGQQQVSQGGVYNFGAPAAGPQRQFNIGSASTPNATGRRVIRKAVRRATQR